MKASLEWRLLSGLRDSEQGVAGYQAEGNVEGDCIARKDCDQAVGLSDSKEVYRYDTESRYRCPGYAP